MYIAVRLRQFSVYDVKALGMRTTRPAVAGVITPLRCLPLSLRYMPYVSAATSGKQTIPVSELPCRRNMNGCNKCKLRGRKRNTLLLL